jgi:cobalt/nickel transport system permease protein
MKRSGIGAAAVVAALAVPVHAAGPARWTGVDETVVERVAAEAGRHRWRTFVDDTGDLPLFLFLCAGLGGGFALGYGYRAIFVERRRPPGEEP